MPIRKRQYRNRNEDDEEEEEEEILPSSALEDIRDLQKLRTRTAGLSAAELALGKDTPTEMGAVSDPFKLKTGGIVNLKMIKTSELKTADIEEDIKHTFSRESHLRDEDEEMRKYVEDELARRKGKSDESEPSVDKQEHPDPEGEVFAVPERLKKYQSKRNEEMLSNQMLCGIPEVDLGIEAKIRNIEETESAKLRLLKEAAERKRDLERATTATQDLLKDLASDYVQHNIYSISETTNLGSESKRPKTDRPQTEPQPVVGEDTPNWVQDGKQVPKPQPQDIVVKKPPVVQKGQLKATDKQCYDKFKSKFIKDDKAKSKDKK